MQMPRQMQTKAKAKAKTNKDKNNKAKELIRPNAKEQIQKQTPT